MSISPVHCLLLAALSELVLIPKMEKMKNYETILNTGEDAANYIQVENVQNMEVMDYELL